jgi:adenosylcobinamide kinase/adenosylcobinamide-phosphate guanylyltransferase
MGELTQKLAPLADQVFLVAAGFVLDLARLGIPLAGGNGPELR